MKSRITILDAQLLLGQGWILKESKNKFFGHSYYLHDVKNTGMQGSAKYINKAVFDVLKKKGF